MRRLAKSIWDLLTDRVPSSKTNSRRQAARRLEVERLEEREVLTNASGTITGVAFIDVNRNGLFDTNETRLPGIRVRLEGDIPNSAERVDVTARTDRNGNYTFNNVPTGGTFTITARPGQGLIRSSVVFSDATSVLGTGSIDVSVAGDATVTRNVAFRQIASAGVSLRQFTTNAGQSSFPFGRPGTGLAAAVERTNTIPTIRSNIANFAVALNSANTVLDLAGNFDDPDLTNSLVRFRTSMGNVDITLFDDQAPRTVANFFNYILSDRYDETFFHRRVAVGANSTISVLQGGGFGLDGTTPEGETLVNSVVDQDNPDPGVQNEFLNSNTAFTLALARVGGQPNSGTSQFFFNLANNTGLNSVDGGFTVFGRVTDPASQAVLNALAALDFTHPDFINPFKEIPLRNYPDDGTGFVSVKDENDMDTGFFTTDARRNQFALLRDVQVVRRDEFLTYTVLSNSNPNLVSVSFDQRQSNRLVLDYAAGMSGTATIKVKATDRFGASIELPEFTVTVGTPSVSVTTTTPTASEADGTLSYTFTRSFASDSALTVNYTVGGSASSGTDFTALPGTVVIPANQTSATVTVTPTNDRFLEGNETVTLTVASGTGYQVGTTNTAMASFTDDESATIAIEATTQVSENGGAQNVAVTLTIAGTGTGSLALGTGITLTADVIDLMTGSAVSGTDYTAFGTQTVTFDNGDTTGTVQNVIVTPIDDGLNEGNLDIDLQLQNLTAPTTVAAVLGNTLNTTTIVEDEMM